MNLGVSAEELVYDTAYNSDDHRTENKGCLWSESSDDHKVHADHSDSTDRNQDTESEPLGTLCLRIRNVPSEEHATNDGEKKCSYRHDERQEHVANPEKRPDSSSRWWIRNDNSDKCKCNQSATETVHSVMIRPC